MILHLVLAAVLPLHPPGERPDTILQVRQGERLVVRNLGGRVLVEGWEEDEVEVLSQGVDRGPELRRRDGEIELRTRPGGDDRDDGTYRIRVPRWMEAEIRGIDASVQAEGLEGGLTVRTVEGSVRVRECRGPVRARSVDGFVEVEGVVGDVVASSADEDVMVRSVTGSVQAENVDGDIRLRNVEGPRVQVVTVDGDVEFEGVLVPGGEYALQTHDGDLTAWIPDPSDVRVFVSTHDGEFRSDFPVTVERLRGGREFEFTLGRGTARLHLEAFDGEIRLLRR